MKNREERQYCPPETVWDALKGKNIVFAGNRTRLRQSFMENLACISQQKGTDFTVSEWNGGIGAADFVLLFGSAEGGIPELDEVLDVLETLARMASGPREGEIQAALPRATGAEADNGRALPAVALISDNRVYGKLYGKPRRLKEAEIGYVCHTAAADLPLQCLRTAEHFACRLARENGMNIRVLRTDAGCDGAALPYMAEAAVKLLLRGAPGEAYNLPCGASGEACNLSGGAPGEACNLSGRAPGEAYNVPCGVSGEAYHASGRAPGEVYNVPGSAPRSRSPLSPIPIVADTEKAEELCGRAGRREASVHWTLCAPHGEQGKSRLLD